MIFEIVVILLVGLFLLVLAKLKKHMLRRFLLATWAVFLFEYFSQALWLNKNLEPWTYLYLDVSWILTVGWAGIILVGMTLLEIYYPKLKEGMRYVLSVLIIGTIGFFAEWVVVGLGIRDYPEAVREGLSGIYLGYGKVPIEALYYIPVFMALMVAFVRYWEVCMDETPKRAVAAKKRTRS